MGTFWDFVGYILTAAGGGGVVLVAYIKFWGKTFVEKRVNESLKEKQHELDAELDKLKSANARINHIMMSLYDEEKEAVKQISDKLTTVVSEVHMLAVAGDWYNKETSLPHRETCYTLMGELNGAINRNRIFIDRSLYEKILELRKLTWSVLGGFNYYANGYKKDFDNSALRQIQQKALDESGLLYDELDKVIEAMITSIEGRKEKSMEG
jgi:hypothetical protein